MESAGIGDWYNYLQEGIKCGYGRKIQGLVHSGMYPSEQSLAGTGTGAEPDRAEPSWAGPSRSRAGAEPDREPGRAGPGQAGPSRAGPDRAGPDRAGQSWGARNQRFKYLCFPRRRT